VIGETSSTPSPVFVLRTFLAATILFDLVKSNACAVRAFTNDQALSAKMFEPDAKFVTRSADWRRSASRQNRLWADHKFIDDNAAGF